jgi:hypothetical protein
VPVDVKKDMVLLLVDTLCGVCWSACLLLIVSVCVCVSLLDRQTTSVEPGLFFLDNWLVMAV